MIYTKRHRTVRFVISCAPLISEVICVYIITIADRNYDPWCLYFIERNQSENVLCRRINSTLLRLTWLFIHIKHIQTC